MKMKGDAILSIQDEVRKETYIKFKGDDTHNWKNDLKFLIKEENKQQFEQILKNISENEKIFN